MKISVAKSLVPVLLALGVIVSFLREIVFAKEYGLSRELEIFRLGYALPSLLSFSVGSSFVSVAVPYLIQAQIESLANRQKIIATVYFVNLTVVATIVIIGWLAAPFVVSTIAPGFDAKSTESLIVSFRICLVMFLLVGVTWTARSQLQILGCFWPGASVTLIKSITFILYFMIAGMYFEDSPYMLERLAVASGFAIFVLHYAHYQKLKIQHLFLSFFSLNSVLIKPFVLAISAVVIFQLMNILPVFIDRSYASGMVVGTVAAVEYCYAIIIAFGTVLATAFNIITLPRFSRLVKEQSGNSGFYKFYSEAFVVFLLGLVVGLILMIFSFNFVTFTLYRGEFGDAARILTSGNLRWMGLGLVSMIGSLILVQMIIVCEGSALLLAVGCFKVVSKWIAIESLIGRFGQHVFGFTFFLVETLTLLVLAAVYLKIWNNNNGSHSLSQTEKGVK